MAGLGITVESCRPGYRLGLPDNAIIDSLSFVDLVRSAAALRPTEPQLAIARLRTGLDLWRDETALPGLALPGVRQFAARLDQLRLTAVEQLAELELEFGDVEQLVSRCMALAMVRPGRVRLVAAVMRALRAADRTSDMLELYDRAQQYARRYGQPVPPLIQHARESASAGHAGQVAVRTRATLYQMPADTSHFTGRAAELAQMRALWSHHGSAPSALVIHAISGMAGIGKSALAIHAAHQLANSFPDGNAYLNLHGYTAGVAPIRPAAALTVLLHGLGVPDSHIPESLEARSALYRSHLARRRVLVLLDNAHDVAQIEPLLPGTPNCMVIVTSRRCLSALDTVIQINLGPLDTLAAVALFSAAAGDRVHESGDSRQFVGEIVRLCGELPLAIRIAAARLRTNRVLSPASLLGRLRRDRENNSLEILDDGERSLARTFLASYEHLTPEQRRAFVLLGRYSTPSFGVRAVSTLLRVNVNETRRLLDGLDQVNLISQFSLDHFRMHSLLRRYAAGLPDQPAWHIARGSGPAEIVDTCGVG